MTVTQAKSWYPVKILVCDTEIVMICQSMDEIPCCRFRVLETNVVPVHHAVVHEEL